MQVWLNCSEVSNGRSYADRDNVQTVFLIVISKTSCQFVTIYANKLKTILVCIASALKETKEKSAASELKHELDVARKELR